MNRGVDIDRSGPSLPFPQPAEMQRQVSCVGRLVCVIQVATWLDMPNINWEGMVKTYVCPKCGSRLVQRSAHSNDGTEYEPDETDVDHEYLLFECGYEVLDNDVQTACGGVKQNAVS